MKHLELALKEVGTVEWAKGDNPKVVAYFKDSGNPGVTTDATAWCAAFVGAMLARAGVKPTGSLMARSYQTWGVPVDPSDIQPGDVLVWPRGTDKRFGHVNIATEKPVNRYVKCVGGNQSDSVNIQSYAVSNLVAARRSSNKPSAWPGGGKMTDKPAAKPVAAPSESWLVALFRAIARMFGARW